MSKIYYYAVFELIEAYMYMHPLLATINVPHYRVGWAGIVYATNQHIKIRK